MVPSYLSGAPTFSLTEAQLVSEAIIVTILGRAAKGRFPLQPAAMA